MKLGIVGLPNVGKSTLFNKLIGERRAIVEDVPGITRDRIYGETEWNGRKMIVIDTGGIERDTDDIILSKLRDQAQVAIDTADVILFVCDIRTGLLPDDRDIAVMLKKSGKPVIPCINKSDATGRVPAEFYEFYELGFEIDPIPLSSIHGTGTGDILDAALDALPVTEAEDDDDDRIRVAVIGKPNAGKSSLVNRILGDERMIVSNIPGTTRDAIDSHLDNEFGKYTFIDTAGIRKKSKVLESIEHYSVLRSYMAVDRADVAVIVIDAAVGFTDQDSKVAGYAHEQGKACIVAVNKWDAIEKETNTMKEFTDDLKTNLGFMDYVPFIFVSAKTGQRINKMFELINFVYANNSMRISTGKLNDILAYATSRVQPPSDKGRRLKVYYMTQPSTNPPTFVTFVNSMDLFHFSYKRYLENQIREVFGGLEGTPIRFIVRERDNTDTK